MTNSEAFDFLVCKILSEVCVNFPVKTNLMKDEYVNLFEVDGGENLEVFYNTVRWLEQHDYIRVEAKTLGADFYHVFPTEKTMLIMGTIPLALQTKGKSMGQHIKDCVTSGTSDAFKDIVKTTIAMGISSVL